MMYSAQAEAVAQEVGRGSIGMSLAQAEAVAQEVGKGSIDPSRGSAL